MCAYVSAPPFSLGVSFYPRRFEFCGYRPERNGGILSLRGSRAALADVGACPPRDVLRQWPEGPHR